MEQMNFVFQLIGMCVTAFLVLILVLWSIGFIRFEGGIKKDANDD